MAADETSANQMTDTDSLLESYPPIRTREHEDNALGSYGSLGPNIEVGISPRSNVTFNRSLSMKSIDSSTSFTLRGSTRRQKAILACLASVDFLSNMCLSIMAPFFPKEANNRGISNSVSGWIFGVFALVQFVTSPLFGKALVKIGSNFLFISGMFFGGGCTVLFGLLDYFPYDSSSEQLLLLSFCFILRIFLALGCTACFTASYAITAEAFPDNVGSVFGILETFTGLGLMIGPALGGVLYQAGGFKLPFVVLGTVMMCCVPICIAVLPKQQDTIPCELQGTQKSSFRNLIRIPAVIVTSVSVVISSLIWSFLDPTLEPHLTEFNLSATIVGLIFLLSSAFYAVSSPIWGWVADKVRDSSLLIFIGFFISTAGCLLLGPSTLIGFAQGYNELWLNIVALVILGASISLAMVPTFEKLLDAAELAGLEDGMDLYSAVAGLWGSASALGEFIGPSLGGMMVDKLGFQWTTTCIAGLCALMGIAIFLLWLYEWKVGPTGVRKDAGDNQKSEDESRPLLGHHRISRRDAPVKVLGPPRIRRGTSLVSPHRDNSMTPSINHGNYRRSQSMDPTLLSEESESEPELEIERTDPEC